MIFPITENGSLPHSFYELLLSEKLDSPLTPCFLLVCTTKVLNQPWKHIQILITSPSYCYRNSGPSQQHLWPELLSLFPNYIPSLTLVTKGVLLTSKQLISSLLGALQWFSYSISLGVNTLHVIFPV